MFFKEGLRYSHSHVCNYCMYVNQAVTPPPDCGKNASLPGPSNLRKANGECGQITRQGLHRTFQKGLFGGRFLDSDGHLSIILKNSFPKT